MEWINVTKELPPPRKRVLVTDGEVVCIAWITEQNGNWGDFGLTDDEVFGVVIGWCELPSAKMPIETPKVLRSRGYFIDETLFAISLMLNMDYDELTNLYWDSAMAAIEAEDEKQYPKIFDEFDEIKKDVLYFRKTRNYVLKYLTEEQYNKIVDKFNS